VRKPRPKLSKRKYLRIKELMCQVKFELFNEGLMPDEELAWSLQVIHNYFDPRRWRVRKEGRTRILYESRTPHIPPLAPEVPEEPSHLIRRPE
jgi:hypothetical protein